MEQLEKAERMFMAGLSVRRQMVRMRMDNCHPVYQVDVGKSQDTSHVRDKQRGEYRLQIFTTNILHCLQR